MKEPVIKVNDERVMKAFSNAKDAMDNLTKVFSKVKIGPLKKERTKKRGAGYTKRRISKRTGKSSSFKRRLDMETHKGLRPSTALTRLLGGKETQDE